MAKPLVNEIFEQVAKLKTKAEKVKYLQQNNLPAVKDVLRINFDNDIVSLLPEGKPPFKAENTPKGMSPSSLHRGFKRFKYFFKGPYSGILKASSEVKNIGVAVTNYFFDQFDGQSYLKQFEVLMKSNPSAVVLVPTFVKETKIIISRLESLKIPYLFFNIDF